MRQRHGEELVGRRFLGGRVARRPIVMGALTLGAALGAGAGCSLINAYDEVLSSVGGQGGAGTGGESGGSTGGQGGEPMGNVGGMDPGMADPGLVLVGGDLDGEVGQRVLLALSPQTGEEIGRIEESFTAVAYEAEREVWFLLQDGLIRAARFDRVTEEWEFLGSVETDVPVVDPGQVFALTDSLAVLDFDSSLHVFDTSNLEAIAETDAIEYPHVGVAGAAFWDAVAVPNSTGGNVFVLWADCPGVTNCDAKVTRLRVEDADAQEIGVATIQSLGVTVTSSAGALAQDPANNIVAVIPDVDGLDPVESFVWTVAPQPSAQDDFRIPQLGVQPRTAAVDPCNGVLYVKDTTTAPLVAAGLVDGERTDLTKGVNVNGQGMFYEPYSRSIILLQTSGADFTVDAWEILGTQLAPDIRKRVGDWQPPRIRPTFAAVATPAEPLCD